MTLNIISDIHCSTYIGLLDDKEHLQFPIGFSLDGLDKTDVLVIAGDIGYTHNEYKLGLEKLSAWCEDNGIKLIHCKGNHDYYLDDETAYPELNGTNESRFKGTVEVVDDTAFIITTGWTPVKDQVFDVMTYLADYRHIPGFSINTNNEMSELQWNFIFDSVQKCSDDPKIKNIVIVTHHVPLEELISEKYKKSSINEAFCMFDKNIQSRIYDEVCANPKVILWAHGHSHEYVKKKIGNTLFIRNPIGYNSERNRKSLTELYAINYIFSTDDNLQDE